MRLLLRRTELFFAINTSVPDWESGVVRYLTSFTTFVLRSIEAFLNELCRFWLLHALTAREPPDNTCS